MVPFLDDLTERLDAEGPDAPAFAAPTGGEPAARGTLTAPVWQPVPPGYDWYGATDPDGLWDVAPSFPRTPGSMARPESTS